MMNSEFIYGKDDTKNIVSIEVDGDRTTIFTENNDHVNSQQVANEYYILTHGQPLADMKYYPLKGEAYYNNAIKVYNRAAKQELIGKLKASKADFHVIYNEAEAFMIKNGYSYYNNMNPLDVSILSFDIETTSLNPESGQVLLISNTFRKGSRVERKLFSYDEYNSQQEMIYAWCNYVRLHNPSILLGHNIFNFDLPYLRQKAGGKLPLGRDESGAKFAKYTSQFRKDGSQSYDYKNVLVYGREIIDTFHLAIKYDTARRYDSYGLKSIIEHEGLEREGRQHWDFEKVSPKQIFEAYENGDEPLWESFKTYAEHDADDSLALFDLMAPSFFYYCQALPKTFQQVINSATGSQVDSFMKRAYLQQGWGLPATSASTKFEGAISFGKPGLYKNVNKVDVASLYPSIILEEKIYDKYKDPKGLFLEMVNYFTKQRLDNKKMAKESGERRYKDLSDAQKIFINSAYGFMGAPGLLFNSPFNAAKVTKTGREILTEGIKWASGSGPQQRFKNGKDGEKEWFIPNNGQAGQFLTIVNADTDSFSYTTGKSLPIEQFDEHITSLNELRPGIIWENDGQFKKVLIVKAKNYVLDDGKKVIIKGSSLKATMKEPALKEFINETIYMILSDRKDLLYDYYMDFVYSIDSINRESIKYWCSKKTITKAVLHPQRTTEQRIKDAITKPVEEGDKIRVFFETPKKLTLLENFNGTIDKPTLYKKLYKTMDIFATVVDVGVFPNFSLKRNEKRLEANRIEIRKV
jgi:DNA polymerase elongation subunit (family B)